MIHELSAMRRNGLIDATDYELAVDAHKRSPWSVTNGLELELTRSSIADATDPSDALCYANDHRGFIYPTPNPLKEYGVNISLDEVYELITPHSQHPYAQFVTMKAMVESGVLPEYTSGEIPTHINIGVYGKDMTKYSDNIIYLLRALELAGGCTAERLLAPFSKTGHLGWAERGDIGYNSSKRGSSDRNFGNHKSRIELRTLRYSNTEQMARINEMAYYLIRAAISERGAPAKIWKSFKSKAVGLDGLPDHIEFFDGRPMHTDAKSSPYYKLVADYFRHYGNYLESEDTRGISDIALQTAIDTRQALGDDFLATSLY